MANDIYFSFGADTGALEAANAKARAEVRSLTAEMNSLGREMTNTGADMDSALGARLNALGGHLASAKSHMAELSAELRMHAAEAGKASEIIASLGEGLGRMAEIAGVALGVDAIKEWIQSATEAAEQTDSMAVKLGASVAEVQQIGAVAALTGTDVNTMATAMERLQLGLAKSQSATSPVTAALKALGIEAAHFRSLSIPQQLDELAAAAAGFGDSATKVAAFQALRRQFVELLPYLNRGKEGLADFNKIAAETGVVLSDKDNTALAATQEASNKPGLAVKSLGQEFALDLNGPLQTSINKLSAWTEAARNAFATARANGGFARLFSLTGPA
jgi:hypothetical protein